MKLLRLMPRGSLLLFSLALLFSLGCSTRIGDFSVLSSGAPQYAAMSEAPMTQAVKGSDGRFWLLFIPLGSSPSIEEAVDRCLDAGKGDFMERARIYKKRWSIILFSRDSYTVVGDVGNSKGGQAKPKQYMGREKAPLPPQEDYVPLRPEDPPSTSIEMPDKVLPPGVTGEPESKPETPLRFEEKNEPIAAPSVL